ncbi:hypothetical protein EVG20_g9366 [Dentipellis fragilis]|uniref:NADH-cytochrome b5 reductase n=1 Tax=Dentipellis fragilis TaxID=205917 RepID=A0A4Y9XYY6_9AGAM|nr:hypothetical protein EVG20_g9366 [Dentipellis fragilis]
MSFIRAATTARSAAAAARRFSTEASAKKSSNYGLYLGGAGVAGLAGYLYLQSQQSAKPKRIQEKSPLDPDNWVDFKLKKVIPYNHNTSEFVFELPNNDASLLPISSCVIVKSSDPEALKDAKGKPVVRPYTPISPSDKEGELTFLVKKYDAGLASKHIHELKEGQTLSIKGPIPKWPWKMNEFEEVALIGGGSGITPLYQILNHALSDPSNKTKFKLIFANVTEDDILLKGEFDAFKKKYPNNFDVVYALDKPSPSWKGYSGYVNAELLKKEIAGPELKEKTKVFICGPPGQVAAIAGKKAGMKQGELGGILKELGYTEDQVYKF